jgi:hypothetical protein
MYKKELNISRVCPFIRFYCALYKKLMDLEMADGIRPLPFNYKIDLKISTDCPFIRFYCAPRGWRQH